MTCFLIIWTTIQIYKIFSAAMHKKITWKKGMRLSAEIFNAMDDATEISYRMLALSASSGRYGLFTTRKPFSVAINITGNALEVTSMSCHGLTRTGCFIDINFDSNFANTFDTRVMLPNIVSDEGYILVVKVNEGMWREIDGAFSELAYSFELLPENSDIPENALPVGRLINDSGWRLDELTFVPPCLFVSAHPKLVNQCMRAMEISREIYMRCISSPDCVAVALICSVWTASFAMTNRLDKERDTLTPPQLLSAIQILVDAFVAGCRADNYISLENQEEFATYAQKPFDARNIFRDIEIGIALCEEISAKMVTVSQITAAESCQEKKQPAKQVSGAPEKTRQERNRWSGLEI